MMWPYFRWASPFLVCLVVTGVVLLWPWGTSEKDGAPLRQQPSQLRTVDIGFPEASVAPPEKPSTYFSTKIARMVREREDCFVEECLRKPLRNFFPSFAVNRSAVVANKHNIGRITIQKTLHLQGTKAPYALYVTAQTSSLFYLDTPFSGVFKTTDVYSVNRAFAFAQSPPVRVGIDKQASPVPLRRRTFENVFEAPLGILVPVGGRCMGNIWHGTAEQVLPLFHTLYELFQDGEGKVVRQKNTMNVALIMKHTGISPSAGLNNYRCPVRNRFPYGWGPPAAISVFFDAMESLFNIKFKLIAYDEVFKYFHVPAFLLQKNPHNKSNTYQQHEEVHESSDSSASELKNATGDIGFPLGTDLTEYLRRAAELKQKDFPPHIDMLQYENLTATVDVTIDGYVYTCFGFTHFPSGCNRVFEEYPHFRRNDKCTKILEILRVAVLKLALPHKTSFEDAVSLEEIAQNPKILFLNRKPTLKGRNFHDRGKSVAAELRSVFDPPGTPQSKSAVTVAFFESGIPVLTQIAMIYNCTALFASRGAGTTFNLFLRRGAGFLMLAPARSLFPAFIHDDSTPWFPHQYVGFQHHLMWFPCGVPFPKVKKKEPQHISFQKVSCRTITTNLCNIQCDGKYLAVAVKELRELMIEAKTFAQKTGEPETESLSVPPVTVVPASNADFFRTLPPEVILRKLVELTVTSDNSFLLYNYPVAVDWLSTAGNPGPNDFYGCVDPGNGKIVLKPPTGFAGNNISMTRVALQQRISLPSGSRVMIDALRDSFGPEELVRIWHGSENISWIPRETDVLSITTFKTNLLSICHGLPLCGHSASWSLPTAGVRWLAFRFWRDLLNNKGELARKRANIERFGKDYVSWGELVSFEFGTTVDPISWQERSKASHVSVNLNPWNDDVVDDR